MRRNTIIILFSTLATLLLGYFFLFGQGEKRFSWKESYSGNSDQPFGTQFIRQLLEEYRPGELFIINDSTPLTEMLNRPAVFDSADYVFIGEQLNLSDEEGAALIDFVTRGNDAFIATLHLPYQLIDSVLQLECEQEIFLREERQHQVTLNFYHKALRTPHGFPYRYEEAGKRKSYPWNAVQPDFFCDSTRSTVALGFFGDGSINFFNVPFGKGNFYFHTTPIAFTNFFIQQYSNADYASRALSHLSGKTIIWDEFSKLQPASQQRETNPLAYIMKQESLKHAWWLMLLTALLYTAFTAKRRQRTIPVLEEKSNTSLEYIRMVSALHFENGDHRDIALKKMKYFLYFVRSRYSIHHHRVSPEMIKRLSEKSKIDVAAIERIFDEHARIEKNPYGSATTSQLITFYHTIDHFYKNCK